MIKGGGGYLCESTNAFLFSFFPFLLIYLCLSQTLSWLTGGMLIG